VGLCKHQRKRKEKKFGARKGKKFPIFTQNIKEIKEKKGG